MVIRKNPTQFSVKNEVANLSMEDPGSRVTAINALTKHVHQLDGNEVPNFLKQVSESLHKSKPASISSHIHAISLFELAARKQRATLVCHLGLMIWMLTTALNSRGFNIGLQQACVKLVRSIANYVICPTALASSQKEKMLRDLCGPLLLKVAEAPRCLHALVETPCWKFASQDLINEASLQATRALFSKGPQTVGHMQLIVSLAKKNGPNLKPHVGILLKAAADILDQGNNWQQRLCSVQMINSFLKSLNGLQLQEIVGVLESQAQDKMPSVRKVVAETISRARLLSESAYNSQKTSMAGNESIFTSTDHIYSSSEQSASLGELEEYGDSDLDRISEVTGWSVRQNPIAHLEMQENMRPADMSGKSIIVGLKGNITVEALEIFRGNENYEDRSNAYNHVSSSVDSSDFVGNGEVTSASSVNMENTEIQQNFSGTTQSEVDLEDTENPEKLTSNGEPEAELEETGNCQSMVQEDKSSGFWWWKKMVEKSLSIVYSSWKKARRRNELVLGASLCAGLIVPTAIVSMKWFGMEEEFHILVPT